MDQRSRETERRPRAPLLYPFALAIFPTLSLAVSNRGENIRPGDLVLPVAICLWVALVTWLIAGRITSSSHRRALITLAVIGWFGYYGILVRALAAFGPTSILAQNRFALPVSLALMLLACRTALRWNGNLVGFSRIMNRVAVLLLLFQPVRYLSASRPPDLVWEPSYALPEPLRRSAGSLPDIYYIVLDAYTGSQSLAANYDFDNSEFEAFLRSRGFFVPRDSHSNYVTTFLALASALNWQYLDLLPKSLGEGSRDRTIPYRMIADNRTTRFLKALGYRVVFFPTAYGATAHNAHADELVPAGDSGQPEVQTEFRSVWLATTALRPLLVWGCLVTKCASNPFPFHPESPELVLWKFAQLGGLPSSSPGPKFVFAHLLVPHEPYVLRADCSAKPLYWPEDGGWEEDDAMRAGYVEQVQCVNRQISLLVDRLLKDSRTPPVIILQADHGNGRFPFGRPPSLDEITPEQLADRISVFAAYHVPGTAAEFHDSITPVNALPAVLRAYFGAPIPPLPDRTYYSSWRAPYRFLQVR